MNGPLKWREAEAGDVGTTLEVTPVMKISLLACLVAFGGCATAPPIVSPGQRQAFADVVRDAEAEGAATEPPEAARLLAEAKSGFDYAQRIPKDPAHARRVLTKAQTDAETALLMARRRHEDQQAARIKARQDVEIATETAPATLPAVRTAPLTTPAVITPGSTSPVFTPAAEKPSDKPAPTGLAP